MGPALSQRHPESRNAGWIRFGGRVPVIKTYEYMLTDLAAYGEVVRERRQEGWRLMRIAVPRIGAGKEWRLIFERDSGR